MNWEMIQELSKNKGEILNHTHSHPKLLELQINEVEKEFYLAEKEIISKIGRLQKGLCPILMENQVLKFKN